MIEYRKGDLFALDHKFIAHGVNCQGVMASGFAKTLREKFPGAYESYIEACKQRLPIDNLGRVRFCMDGDNVQIAHCFTQLNFGRDPVRYVDYDAVDDCMRKLNSFMNQWNIPYFAMPKIGAGLGNGNWGIIEAIIKANCPNNKIVVYEL